MPGPLALTCLNSTIVCPKHFSLGSCAPAPLHLQLQSQKLATKEKRGTLITIQMFQAVPHHLRSPEFPVALHSPSCSQKLRGGVYRNHIPPSSSLIYALKQELQGTNICAQVSLNLHTDLDIPTRTLSKWQREEAGP